MNGSGKIQFPDPVRQSRKAYTKTQLMEPSPSKMIIVSNRLPLKAILKPTGLSYQPSEGGLATGISSVFNSGKHLWLGWPGASFPDEAMTLRVQKDLEAQNLIPIFLTEQEVNEFYEGFANETLWPLFHYFPSNALYRTRNWETYLRVNQKFADAVVARAGPGDLVWIHDYQLLLVPQMIRNQMPELSIGFFQHIPFPYFEIFRLLPWRREILTGMLGADLIGFHTLDDSKHFVNACTRLLEGETHGNRMTWEGRQVISDVFPMGIDFVKFQDWAGRERTRKNAVRLRQAIGNQKLMITVDRLDYTKGIPARLDAYYTLLEDNPEIREKISMVQLLVPSRDQVPLYRDLKDEIDKKVSAINSRFSTIGWTPIFYFYRSFPMDLLSALYTTADIAVVTPMRDGMNLVSKEFVASKLDKKGVLILSEMAGASKELQQAVIVNPNNKQDMVRAMLEAIRMEEDEQRTRMEAMQEIISRYNVYHWVDLFVESLLETKRFQNRLSTKKMTPSLVSMIRKRYQGAHKRILMLDYDGTLMPFFSDIYRSEPDPGLKNLINALKQDPANRVVVVSGRDYLTLGRWLEGLDVDIIAEHGVWKRILPSSWEKIGELSEDWKGSIRHLMDYYTERTPGSFIEEKSYSLAWHYRKVSADFGTVRAHELEDNLNFFSQNHALTILQGNRVLEVKPAEVNKGKAAKGLLKQEHYDFILAIGDDATDEDTFRAMPARAITIRVGSLTSSANYFMDTVRDVRRFLEELINPASPEPKEK